MKRDIIVLDLETLRSAEDCRNCGLSKDQHLNLNRCPSLYADQAPTWVPIGWEDKLALGLSIGAYYSFEDDRMHWFDEHNLEETVAKFVDEQPIMVSFNGISFDFPLMHGILRRWTDNCSDEPDYRLHDLCDAFKSLAANSYDILAEIWRVDPDRKFERGLNSLDALSQANGFGPKLSNGAQAPRDWAAGRHAHVINYCQDDVIKTWRLMLRVSKERGELIRGDGSPVWIRYLDADGIIHDPIMTQEKKQQ